MIFMLLYGVSRQQTPSRPINATDHCTEYFVLSRALQTYNVLCATYQGSLMCNVQYICLSLKGWFHRHFAKAKHIVHTAHALAPQFNTLHTLVEDRRARVLRNVQEPILLGITTESPWSWNYV